MRAVICVLSALAALSQLVTAGDVDRCALCMWFIETLRDRDALGGKMLFDRVTAKRCDAYHELAPGNAPQDSYAQVCVPLCLVWTH
jgi:hypothetical protein